MSARFALIAAFAVMALSGAPAGARTVPPAAKVECRQVNGAVTKADVACALRRWYARANSHDPDAVTALYAKTDVLLLSTLKAQPLTDRDGIWKYFKGLVTKPGFEVVPVRTIPDDKIDLFGGGGVDSGFYEFRWTEKGVTKRTPARFSFVFVLDAAGRGLLIATHHSSEVPADHDATRGPG